MKFTLDHLCELHPYFIRHEAATLQTIFELTKEELESPLFPKFFVTLQSQLYTTEDIQMVLVGGSKVGGRYYLDTSGGQDYM